LVDKPFSDHLCDFSKILGYDNNSEVQQQCHPRHCHAARSTQLTHTPKAGLAGSSSQQRKREHKEIGSEREATRPVWCT